MITSRRTVAVLAVGLALFVSAAACGRGSETPRAAAPATTTIPPPTTTVPPNLSVVAEATVPSVGIYDSPDQPGPAQALPNPQEVGAPLVFLVKEQRPQWVNVHLPVRPNGSTGWVHRSDVKLATHNFRIVVELGAHQVTVWKGAEVFVQEPVGLGTGTTPTPGGLFYTRALLQPKDDAGNLIVNGPYGPFAYVLSGYSEVLYEFAGGNGELGIHGTNDPSGLGTDVSHGCIRMSNEGITKLSEVLPLGVPVEVTA